MPTTILLVRHGETDWNLERRVQGHADRPLNGTGLQQARALAEQLAGERLDAVYASDLVRASETAALVARSQGLEVQTLPELREKHFGSWEGLTDVEVLERYPDARRGAWGDGETAAEVAERVLGALRAIALRHPGGRVLVVSHGGPLRAVLRACDRDAGGPIRNCHVLRVKADDGRLRALD